MLLEYFSIFTFKLQCCDLNEKPHGLFFLLSTIQDPAVLLAHYLWLSILHCITVTVRGYQVWFLLLPGLAYCSKQMSCQRQHTTTRASFQLHLTQLELLLKFTTFQSPLQHKRTLEVLAGHPQHSARHFLLYQEHGDVFKTKKC